MNKLRSKWMLMLYGAIIACTLTLQSCKAPDKDTIVKSLNTGASYATSFGLDKWANKDKPAATECATALSKNIKDVLVPYLNNGKLPSSAEVQAFINSSLFNDLKPEIKDLIVAASLALDAVLPIPSANVYLNQDQVDYIKAFLTGIQAGCDKFLGAKEIKKPIWFK